VNCTYRRAVTVSIVASIASRYGMFKAGVIGSAGLVFYGAVVGFTPIILAVIASRFFTPEQLRPV